jgi:hypothetical protein
MRNQKLYAPIILAAAFILTAAFAFQPQKAGTVYATEGTTVESVQQTDSGVAVAQENAAGQTTEQTAVQTEVQTMEQTAVQTDTQTTEQAVVQTEAQTTEQVAEKTAEQQAQAKDEIKTSLQNDPTHVHHFKWIYKMNESETAEGTVNYMCTECGKIWYFRPIEAYYAFQGDLARRIELAPEYGTVNVKTSHFISFNKQVMQALAARPDVSVKVSFLEQEYKGNRVSFTIPAGVDSMALLDENGYAGFLYLGGIYGLTLEEAADIPETTGEGAETDATVAQKATTEEVTEVTYVATVGENGETIVETVVENVEKNTSNN